jgi:hypothetical protein
MRPNRGRIVGIKTKGKVGRSAISAVEIGICYALLWVKKCNDFNFVTEIVSGRTRLKNGREVQGFYESGRVQGRICIGLQSIMDSDTHKQWPHLEPLVASYAAHEAAHHAQNVQDPEGYERFIEAVAAAACGGYSWDHPFERDAMDVQRIAISDLYGVDLIFC